ncbi:uncharacterized protein LOC134245540 [Saccostrea cucullata]|uniref:uncharacterized protein LOC134245540 n=1 Tax=Saccostrea cuccullata TaxID=36930 RepID=UPI002ED514D4
MPSSCCCVPGCHERCGHQFPTEKSRRDKWIIAIKRLDEHTRKLWEPSKSAVVCKRHFKPDDYVTETIQGQKPLHGRLKSSSVPSIFCWTKSSAASTSRSSRVEGRVQKKRKFEEACHDDLEDSINESNVDFVEEIVSADESTSNDTNITSYSPEFREMQTQTQSQPLFSVDHFEKDDAAIHFYTGLETYSKFMYVLHSLGPAAYCLNYIFFRVQGVSIPDQFFMTLMKLRRYTTNFELSRFFNVSESTVKNIVYTWIIFMSKQWQEVSIWPPQSLVRYFSPSDFKAKFPKTRAILDVTEFPIKKPSSPRAQQATFSTYKNRNMMKALIGCTPGGLISFISPAYSGSTSDRQIVERSSLKNLCDQVPKSCQDLFNCSGTMTDGEYWIYPKATNGQRVKIYCHNMGTGASEYITLMNSNYFIQHDPTNWPIKFQQCQSNYLLPLKKVDFMKVGIQIQNMEINGNDYNFTLLTGSPTISYGETMDCNGESFQDPCPRFSQAVINTTGTGLIVDPTLTWGAIHGWSPEIRNLQRSQDNAQITFHCAGWCGRCGPVSQSIRFQQSDEFISGADAQALICNA